jgi:hypothetical protein
MFSKPETRSEEYENILSIFLLSKATTPPLFYLNIQTIPHIHCL